MSSKLRPLYDRIYMGVDVGLLALRACGSARRRAAAAGPAPGLDQAYSGAIRPFWRQFRVAVPKKYWFRAYGADPRYIPDDLWLRRIIPHFNTILFAQALQDKCMHNVFVPGMKRPRTIVKNVAGVFCGDDLVPIPREEAVDRCRDAGRILIKPSVGSGQGHDIRFYDSDGLTREQIEDIFRLYGRNFILQEKMAQHPALAALNPNSLNTVRILTFLFRNEVRVLSAILRVGGGENEVDNVSQGGYQCAVRPDGQLESLAATRAGGPWIETDVCANGVRFGDVTIPRFREAVETVKAAALKMPHFKLLGWDIAIDPSGEPVLIEYNVIPDQNQTSCGPTFGDLTDDVLADVFGRR